MNNNTNERMMTRTQWQIGLLILGVMFALAGWAWFQIPAGEQIPIHWGSDGQADGWGSKFEGLFLFPLITTGMMALLGFIPNIEPRKRNLNMSGTAYRAFFIAMMLFMLGMYIASLFSIFGHPVNMNVWMAFGLGGLFIVLGNFMGKVRSNHIFGVRTPWTLASDLAWNKTHRLAGWSFVGHGALLIVAGITAANLVLWLLFGGLLLQVVVLMPYSYYVWRGDQTMEM